MVGYTHTTQTERGAAVRFAWTLAKRIVDVTDGASCVCLGRCCTPDSPETVLTLEFAKPSGFALRGLMQPFPGPWISICAK